MAEFLEAFWNELILRGLMRQVAQRTLQVTCKREEYFQLRISYVCFVLVNTRVMTVLK